ELTSQNREPTRRTHGDLRESTRSPHRMPSPRSRPRPRRTRHPPRPGSRPPRLALILPNCTKPGAPSSARILRLRWAGWPILFSSSIIAGKKPSSSSPKKSPTSRWVPHDPRKDELRRVSWGQALVAATHPCPSPGTKTTTKQPKLHHLHLPRPQTIPS